MDSLSLDLAGLRDTDIIGSGSIVEDVDSLSRMNVQHRLQSISVRNSVVSEVDEEESMQLQSVIAPSDIQNLGVDALSEVSRLRVAIAPDVDHVHLHLNVAGLENTESSDLVVGEMSLTEASSLAYDSPLTSTSSAFHSSSRVNSLLLSKPESQRTNGYVLSAANPFLGSSIEEKPLSNCDTNRGLTVQLPLPDVDIAGHLNALAESSNLIHVAVKQDASAEGLTVSDVPMITLVDNDELDSNAATCVHTVNENSSAISGNSIRTRSNVVCFLCGAKHAVSARGAVDLLGNETLSSTRNLTLLSVLSEALDTDASCSEVLQRTSLLCKKCFKQLDDFDALVAQVADLKKDMQSKFIRNRGLDDIDTGVFHDSLANGGDTDDTGAPVSVTAADTPPPATAVMDNFFLKQEPVLKEEDSELAEGDTEFKLHVPNRESRRARGRKRGRGRGRGVSRSAVRLTEVKEEEPDLSCSAWSDRQLDRVEMIINSSNLLPLVTSIEDTSAASAGHHFLDPGNAAADEDGSDGSASDGGRHSADAVVLDCLDIWDPNDREAEDHELDGQSGDTSSTAAVLFALPSPSVAASVSSDGVTIIADEAAWPRYRCHYCPFADTFYHRVILHIREEHQDKLFECEACALNASSEISTFSTRSALLRHLDEHLQRGDRGYHCNSCAKRFPLPRMLRDHRRHHIAKSVLCALCPRRFRSEQGLQEHMFAHTGCRPFPCDYCGKRFMSRYTLKTHLKTHMARERNYKCDVCAKEFLSQHHLMDHRQLHEAVKKFVCENCGKAFSTARSLDLHMIVHTGVKNYKCRMCSKQFARKGELEDHERTHTGEKPFQCEFCGATFSQRSNLQSHKRATHLKETKHQCEHCHRKFKRRRLLVYHVMSVHTGERPYKCNSCKASFVYPEHYKKHLRIHTGEKPFKCDICDKAFNSRDNRNAHKFIHSDRKPYECTLCKTGFMRKPLLISHILQHGNTAEDAERYISVNPPTVADQTTLLQDFHLRFQAQTRNVSADEVETDFYALNEAGTLTSLKLSQDDGLEGAAVHIMGDAGMSVVNRPVHIIDADDLPRYILPDGGRAGEPFLATLQGQVVEVRADGSVHYFSATAARDDESCEDMDVADADEATEETIAGMQAFELHLGNSADDEDASELELQSISTVNSSSTMTNGDASVIGDSGDTESGTLLSRSFGFDSGGIG